MEYLLLALAAGAMGVGWWWLGRRRKELLGGSDDPASLIPPADPGPPEVFTRESLVSRERRFDPAAWDDGPGGDTAGPGDPDDLPTRFDRSYLERTSRKPPAPTPAADPVPDPTSTATPMVAADDDQPEYFDREFLERKQRERHQPPPEPDA